MVRPPGAGATGSALEGARPSAVRFYHPNDYYTRNEAVLFYHPKLARFEGAGRASSLNTEAVRPRLAAVFMEENTSMRRGRRVKSDGALAATSSHDDADEDGEEGHRTPPKPRMSVRAAEERELSLIHI